MTAKLRRVTTKAFLSNLRLYLRDGDPEERWEFDFDGLHGRIDNGWRSGLQLTVNGELLAQSTQQLALSKTKPVLSAIYTDQGRQYHIAIFIQAIFETRLNVEINGKRLSKKFV